MGKRRSPSKNVPPKRRRLPKEPEFIDLCPVINPRVLYYIDNFTKDRLNFQPHFKIFSLCNQWKEGQSFNQRETLDC